MPIPIFIQKGSLRFCIIVSSNQHVFISESTFLVFAKQSKIGCSIVSTVSKRKMHCLLRRHKPNVISDLDVMYIAFVYLCIPNTWASCFTAHGCQCVAHFGIHRFLKSFRQIIFFQARAPVRIAKCRLDVGHRLLVRIVRFIFFVCK